MMGGMEHDIGAFLRSRRARMRPEDVGLPDFGRRRVPGLRREELARLASVSVDYYVRLEQGRTSNVSDGVLDAVAGALGLSDVERDHLRMLAHARADPATAPDDAPQTLAPGLGDLLGAIADVPAFVLGRRTDVLGCNALGGAVTGFATLPPADRNSARWTFGHPESRERYADWHQVAADTVAFLALDAGRHPGDPKLAALIGELSIESEDFRRLWARHDVLEQTHGTKRVRHPVVGELSFAYRNLTLEDTPDQWLCVLVAESGSPTTERLRLLGSWIADAPPA
jgi:transcriptional regulator with XRE-family HTH domain